MFRLMLHDAMRHRLAIRFRAKPTYSDLFGPTERASAYNNNDAFDETFFANENIILCDSYKQLLVEKGQYNRISTPPPKSNTE